MPTEVDVRFEPSGRVVRVAPGTTVMEASARAGITIPAPCGGRGVCGACGVRVLEGELGSPDEYEAVGLARAPKGVRLSCRARVGSEPVVLQPIVAHGVVATATGGTAATDAQTQRSWVAGVDLGTTTVSAQVMDASTGEVVGRGATANRQQSFGSDVVSRVAAALDGKDQLLREAAEASIADALGTACGQGGCAPGSVERVAVAGNTAMTALLAGVSPEGLASHPFSLPIAGVGHVRPGAALASALAGDATVDSLPCIAAFVGGDTTAALLGTGLLEGSDTRLLVDLGTNAEIALVHDNRLWVASAAAGPAFEAGGVRCGGPAIAGGVVAVCERAGELELTVVDGAEPMWLAGSGVVSAIAELRRVGHIRPDGLMIERGPLERLFSRDAEGVLGIGLAGDGAGCVRLDQLDVRAFQLAKAAVAVATSMVLDAARVRPRRIAETLIAGAFGAALDPADLAALGVLPKGLAAKARAAGDAALEGASRTAMRPSLAITAATWVAEAQHVDIAADPRFNDRLLKAMDLVPG